MEATPSSPVTSSWLLLTPRTSPKRRAKVSDAYSWFQLKNRAPRPSMNTKARAVMAS